MADSVKARSGKDVPRSVSKSEFKKRAKAMLLRHGGPEEELKAEDFESWDDLEDFLRYWTEAEDVGLKEADVAPLHRRSQSLMKAESSLRSDGETSDRDRTKHPSTGRSRGAAKRVSPGARRFSAAVEPGVFKGPPWRLIRTKFMHPEIDISKAKFRRQRSGAGKCTGVKLKQTTQAYSVSYSLAMGALAEVRSIKQSGADRQILWHGSVRHKEASLAYWFGADYSTAQINRMLTKIEEILFQWSLGFCAGFRGLLPVFIRCKSTNNVGGSHTYARHLVKNTIELLPRYFDQTANGRIITLLHEMGHRSTALLRPRDERHPLCGGGWNRKENMCYRARKQVDSEKRLFRSGNPRALAEAAGKGDVSARKTALNNIDNYVCYMWNREIDHGLQLLKVMPPEVKPQPKPARRPDNSKPASR